MTSDPPPILVCMLASSPAVLADDRFADCRECGIRLRHRPHSPADARKVCMDCAVKLINAMRKAGEEIRPGITRETLRDLQLFYSRGRKQ